MVYSLNRTTCFGQGRPSSGRQEPGYAYYRNFAFRFCGRKLSQFITQSLLTLVPPCVYDILCLVSDQDTTHVISAGDTGIPSAVPGGVIRKVTSGEVIRL